MSLIDEETSKSWTEYRRLVLGELERLNASVIVLDKKMDGLISERDERMRKMEISIAMLQVKSGVWGALSGALVAVAAIVFSLLKLH